MAGAGAGAAQPQLPRPWFRLGSITRPTTAPTTAPEPPRPALVRPPIIRPPAHTEPSEPTPPPPQSAAVPSNSKSPPTPPLALALPRPTTSSFPSSPSATKKLASPPTASFTTPVFPSPSSLHVHTPASSAHSSPPQEPLSPSATMPPLKSTPLFASESNPRVALPPSPTHSDSPINRTFPSRSPSPSPVPSPAAPSPYQSPKLNLKPSASPPSPLLLPPSQLQSVGQPKHDSIPQEVERKAVVVQKIVDKPAQSDHFFSYHVHKPGFGKNGKQSVRRDDDQGKEKGMRAKNDQESNMRVVTMAGENRGALMEVILCDKNNSHQIRGINESENEEEGSVNNNHKGDHRSKKSMGTNRNSLSTPAFFNSNVQGINNSILLESAFTHHDPGIHIVYSRTPRSTNELEDGQQ